MEIVFADQGIIGENPVGKFLQLYARLFDDRHARPDALPGSATW